MERDYLASDDRFFFEQELVPVLRTKQYADGWEAASAKAFGSGERTLIEFRCKLGQKSLLSFLNLDARDLSARGVNGTVLAQCLLTTMDHSPLFDRYEFDLDASHLVFRISEYRRIDQHGRDCAIDPHSHLWTGDAPLMRVVDMDVRQLVVLPR